jgi:hypothetical protein
MVRAIAITTGAGLIVVAFAAAFGVADTRQGLIAEVVTLLAGLVGTGLLIYGLVPSWRSGDRKGQRPAVRPSGGQQRTATDLIIGLAGLLLAAVLLSGLAISGGWLWAVLGGVLLLPMIVGCTYLVAAFARAPDRSWRVDLRRIGRRREDST